MSLKPNTIISLENGEKYVVINQAIYQDRSYYLVGKTTDDEQDLTGEIKIVEEVMQDGMLGIRLVNDAKLLELLTKYLDPQA